MDCVQETYLRLMNSRFCVIWAGMNRLILFFTKGRLQTIQNGKLVKECKGDYLYVLGHFIYTYMFQVTFFSVLERPGETRKGPCLDKG